MSLLNLLEEFVMFEKIRKMKNKKGFTLVELIVVLVILAILAALLIPALTGFCIDQLIHGVFYSFIHYHSEY